MEWSVKCTVIGQRRISLCHSNGRRCSGGVGVCVGIGHRRAVDRALASHAFQTEETQKSVAELGRHQIVQYRINSRIEVDHDATKVDQHVIDFRAHPFRVVLN